MSNSAPETPLSADFYYYLRHQLRGRRGLIAAAAAIGLPALWLGWPWLVVAGVTPILIALAPCAIMCALGLCAMRAATKANRAGADASELRSDEAGCCSQTRPIGEKLSSQASETAGSAVERAVPLISSTGIPDRGDDQVHGGLKNTKKRPKRSTRKTRQPMKFASRSMDEGPVSSDPGSLPAEPASLGPQTRVNSVQGGSAPAPADAEGPDQTLNQGKETNR